MEVHFSARNADIQNIIDRLTEMSLAYKEIQDQEAHQPSIRDGSKEYVGIEAMKTYLDQLDNEKEQWYYCNC